MTRFVVHCLLILCAAIAATNCFAATNEISEPYQGVRLIHSVSTVPRLIDIYVVEIDMSAPGLSLLVSPSNGGLPGDNSPQTTRDFVTQVGAQFGINGAFYNFSTNGQLDALGLSVSNGDIYSQFEPGWLDAFNVSQDNVATIIRAAGRGGVLHTPDVPLYNAINGNIRLVTNGVAITQTSAVEPRTAVGVTGDGKLILFTVDGRMPAHSNGLTYAEMSSILVRWGVRDAINLDGGTSTTLVMDNPATAANDPGVINVPSDGFEGAVANNFAVFARPQSGPTEKRFVFADFEQGDVGTFTAALSQSTSTRGIDNAQSRTDAVSGGAFDGQWSQRLTIKDDPASNGGPANPNGAWVSEHLSGLGDPANNVSRPLTGLLDLWAKTTNPDLRIAPAIDEPGAASSIQGILQNLIADGQWHEYSWALTDPSQWGSGGSNVASTFTLHSIQIFGPPATSANADAVVYLDSISHVIPAQVPEPASGLIAACAIIVASLRRQAAGFR